MHCLVLKASNGCASDLAIASARIHIYIYIFIYSSTYVYTCIYIYIYIYETCAWTPNICSSNLVNNLMVLALLASEAPGDR